MRPDAAALRELDGLVRNLGEQLAVYRRRALAAERAIRDMEKTAETHLTEIGQLRETLGQLRAERDMASKAVREFEHDAELLRKELASSISANEELARRANPEVVDRELVLENDRLRASLGEIRERTGALADRLQFLRQQTGQGGAD